MLCHELNEISINGILLLGAPEIAEHLDILLLGHVELAFFVVLELGVVDGLLWDSGTTEKPDTLDFKFGLLTQNGVLGHRVLTELLEALNETIAQVDGLEEHLALSAEHLVLQVPESPAFIDKLEKQIDTSTSLVGMVGESGLEGEKIELGRGKEIERVLFLLGLFIFITFGLLGLGSGSSGLDNLLVTLSELRGNGLLGEFDVAKDGNPLGKLANAVEPGSPLRHSLLETSIKESTSSHHEVSSEDDISDGGFVSNEPVVVTEGNVHGLDVGLGVGGALSVSFLGLHGMAEGSHKGGELSGKASGDSPVKPLVNLGTLNSVGAHHLAAVGKELSDGNRLVDAALGGLEHGELHGHVHGLVSGGGNSVLVNNLDIDLLVGHLGNNLASHAEEVEGVVDVQFHLIFGV